MRRLAGGIAAAVFVLACGADAALAAEPVAAPSFVSSVAQSGMLEVEAARVALGASQDTAVKEYAYRIIYDHEKMNADLADIARKRDVPVPAALDAEHAAILQSLRNAPAQAFDAAYFTQVARDCATTAELLQSNLLNTDAELAVFSSYNLPKVREHGRLADELKARLKR